jgi:hypothetical protein
MTLRQLISKLTYLSQKDGFDLDGEVLVNLYDKNGGNIKDLPITDTDWVWADIFDNEDTRKIVVIQAQMTD